MPGLLYFFLYVFYLVLFIAVIKKWRFFKVDGVPARHLIFFFLLKVIAGILLTLVYTYYYTDHKKADIYRYFNDSGMVSPLLFKQPLAWLQIMLNYNVENPEVFKFLQHTQYFSHPKSDWVTNNTFIIRINVLLNYFSWSNIFINTLFFNFISFAGLAALFKIFQPYFAEQPKLLYMPVFLLPSVVFWSSGLLKESLALTGISFYLLSVLRCKFFSVKCGFLALMGLIIVALTKPHVVILLLIFSITFFSFKNKLSFALRLVLLIASFVAGIFLWGKEMSNSLLEKRNEFIQLAIAENAGTSISENIIQPTQENFIKLLPEAFINAVFRPFWWEKGKLFQLIFAVENLFFIVLILIFVVNFKIPIKENRPLFFFCLIFSVGNYLIIGITVPVTGAIVHYRIIAEPFLLIAVMLASNVDFLKKLKMLSHFH